MEEHKRNWNFPTAIETVVIKEGTPRIEYHDIGLSIFLDRFGVELDDPIVTDARKRHGCTLCDAKLVSSSAWNLSMTLNEISYFLSKTFMSERIHKFICDVCNSSGEIPEHNFASSWNVVAYHYPELFELKTIQQA